MAAKFQKGSQIYKIVYQEAENDLLLYLEEQEEENMEYDLETPLYWIELKKCKDVDEIHDFMREFGWKKRKTIRSLNNDIVNLRLRV